MTIQTREVEFAHHIDQIAEAIRWPDASFTVTPWDLIVGVAVTFYEAFATPDRVMLEHALNGIAF
jgi:hypothetical protein